MILWFPRTAATLLVVILSACGGSGGGTQGASGTITSTSDNGSAAAGTGAGMARGLGAPRSGWATWYAADGSGACSYDAASDRRVTALATADFGGSAACGTYLTVNGPKGSVMVKVVDRCPECEAGQLDLSAEAFAAIADPEAGKVAVTWQAVEGPQTDAVQYRYKEGSSPYWLGLQVRNHRLPVTRLEIQPGGSGPWVAVPRTDFNYFVYTQGVPASSVQVRITSSAGSQLTDTLSAPQGGWVGPGQAQFP